MKTHCFASLLAASLFGCATVAPPGHVNATADNPIVSVRAGLADFQNSTYGRNVYYLIDRNTETCWFSTTDAVAPMDCCAVRKVPQAASIVTWATDATCGAPKAIVAAPSVH
jgi:hypothetical protein